MSARHAVRPSALAEGIFRREVLPWGLLGLALGLVEGATAAVLVKQHFTGVAPQFAVNMAVAVVSLVLQLLSVPLLLIVMRKSSEARP